MNKVTTILSFEEMYTDRKFYRLIFPYKNSEYPIKQNLELINKLYTKYLIAKEENGNPKRRDIFNYWHFMNKEFYLERGYSLKEAEELIQNKINKRKKTFEKKSPDFKDFQYLFGDKEIHLIDDSSGKVRYYDLCIPECKIIVEYNGYLYHPINKDTYLKDGKIIKAKDSIENDDLKYKIAIENGYKIFYLYEVPNKLLKEYQQAKNLANIIYEYYISERNS